MGVPAAFPAPTSKQPTRLRRAFGVGTTAVSTALARNIRACRAEALCEGGYSAVSFNASCFNDLALRSIFPRNEPPNPAKYLGERPEMTTQ
jgi:hypothetical protein